MKAIVHSRYGTPDVLELKDIDRPVINDDQVLVWIHAFDAGPGIQVVGIEDRPAAGAAGRCACRASAPGPRAPPPGLAGR